MHYYSILKYFLALAISVVCNFANTQENDLLDELDSISEQEVVFENPAFKALQICNLQSTKMVAKKDFYMVVAHRFGSIKSGIKELYGLDQANTKILFIYGISDRLQLGISRDSYEKTYSATSKLSLLKQSNNRRVNLVLYNSVDVNTLLNKNTYPGLLFLDRFAYSTQILISRGFSEKLSIELAPIYVRQNLIDLKYAKTSIPPIRPLGFLTEPWNQYILAIGGRYKFTKRISFNLDYGYNFSKSKNSLYRNPLSVGIDIETGGHVFQLLFTNSRASNDAAFLTETLGDWTKGDISFGFNIVRVF